MRWRLAVGLAVYVGLRPPSPMIAPSDQPAQFVTEYSWDIDEEWFGGFSGLEMLEDGLGFLIVSDKAEMVVGNLIRTGDQITGVAIDRHFRLRDDEKKRIGGNRRDAEGIALDVDGSFFVSFETVHRVWKYKSTESGAEWASYSENFREFVSNGGFEAIAIDSQGRVYALPESPISEQSTAPLYRYDPTLKPRWQIVLDLPRKGRFLPVGADFGPDGRLYLLERDVFPFGFRSRVRMLTIENDALVADDIVLETRLGRHGNLEGLSVWQDGDGNTRLTMVADDNFYRVQNTEFVEYVLKGTP